MINKYEIKKIINLRKKTNFSITLCKKALEKNNLDIEKSIKYLRKLKINNNKKIINNNGIIYSSINKKKNIGVILKINLISDFVINNNLFKKFVKNIIYIIFKKKIKNKKELLNNKIINNKLLDLNIMFKEKIVISNFFLLKSNYVNIYNHYNYKLSSIVGFKLKNNKIKKNKKKNKILKLITKNIAINILVKKLKKKKINKYFLNKKKLLELNFLKRIKLNYNEYINFFKKNIYIKNFKFFILN
ncbi:MAG: hypothetical protein NHG11_00870 [Candidatus Shikimatogenerans bostrichidophilus]|nr:MAG: hypothetical protein NHG11_00870 [Candidatus Shikimatogenerans bostrichidophilus]